MPKTLQGFWHFEVQNSGDWDGSLIGEDYVEFFYKVYQVTDVEKRSDSSYLLRLKPEEGDAITLNIDSFDGEHAQLKFSGWPEAKNCTRLDYPVDTEPVDFADMPKPLFKKWIAGDGQLTFQLHDKNKVFFENQNWEVLSIGYYQNKEYRILVKNDKIHKFIYVLNVTDKHLLVASNLKNTLFVPMADNPDVYKILGNWAEKENNSWRFGFFEEFAIFDGELYSYKSLECDGSRCEVVLDNGEKTVDIKFDLISKEECEVKIDGQKAVSFFKVGKNLPAYTTADHTKFLDTEFNKIDTVTIRGYLRNNPQNKPFSAGFNDPIKQGHVEFFADVDQNGFFTLKFPLINTTQVFLDWGRMTKMDVVEPGESYFLFFDFSNQQHLVNGDNERFHNEFTAYEVYSPWRNRTRGEYERIEKLSQMEYLKVQKQDLEKGHSHLENYIIENPNVSDRFKYFYKNYYRFEAGFHLMQRFFTLDRRVDEKFPEEYMAYVKDTLYNNTPPKPCTLVREFFSFTRDRINYKQYLEGRNSLSVKQTEALIYLEEEGKITLTDEQKMAIPVYDKQLEVLFALTQKGADSLQLAKAMEKFNEVGKPIMELFEKEPVKDFMQNEWRNIASEKLDRVRYQGTLSIYDEVIPDKEIKDIFEAQLFYQYIDYHKSAMPKYMKTIMDERIESKLLRAEVEKFERYYTDLSKQDILYVESLKNTNHLKDAKDADSLFTALTEPYRGKVIYVDFWGSWCGPCKQQMKFVHDVKEALKGKDVIFMYFANRSAEEAWKNVIKENQLSGENAVHYRLPPEQQAMIERRLSIRAFPTYILMDAEGNIVNMKAPRPEQKRALVTEITKLLNE
ncbi:MAG: TlpA family protein disulfide reductase [Draconibacterium sp.]